jgi:hypothetical protein
MLTVYVTLCNLRKRRTKTKLLCIVPETAIDVVEYVYIDNGPPDVTERKMCFDKNSIQNNYDKNLNIGTDDNDNPIGAIQFNIKSSTTVYMNGVLKLQFSLSDRITDIYINASDLPNDDVYDTSKASLTNLLGDILRFKSLAKATRDYLNSLHLDNATKIRYSFNAFNTCCEDNDCKDLKILVKPARRRQHKI